MPAANEVPRPPRPHVIVIGGGFGGVAAARALARAPVDVTLIDRRNHQLFQPLLYQVATGTLDSCNVAEPLRASRVPFGSTPMLATRALYAVRSAPRARTKS